MISWLTDKNATEALVNRKKMFFESTGKSSPLYLRRIHNADQQIIPITAPEKEEKEKMTISRTENGEENRFTHALPTNNLLQ